MAAQQAQLQLLGQLLRDRLRDEAAEAGVDAVRVLARAVRGALDEPRAASIRSRAESASSTGAPSTATAQTSSTVRSSPVSAMPSRVTRESSPATSSRFGTVPFSHGCARRVERRRTREAEASVPGLLAMCRACTVRRATDVRRRVEQPQLEHARRVEAVDAQERRPRPRLRRRPASGRRAPSRRPRRRARAPPPRSARRCRAAPPPPSPRRSCSPGREPGPRQVEAERAHAREAAARLAHDRGDRARGLDVAAAQVDVERDQRPPRADEHRAGARVEPRRPEVGRELAARRAAAAARPAPPRRKNAGPRPAPSSP